jgi:hypothetical protein
VAEQRARSARSATAAAVALAFAFGLGIPCLFGGDNFDDEAANRIQNLSALVSLGWVPLTCIALVLRAIAGRFTRLAAKPLPSPADPTVPYREAPTECQRHPFAR